MVRAHKARQRSENPPAPRRAPQGFTLQPSAAQATGPTLGHTDLHPSLMARAQLSEAGEHPAPHGASRAPQPASALPSNRWLSPAPWLPASERALLPSSPPAPPAGACRASLRADGTLRHRSTADHKPKGALPSPLLICFLSTIFTKIALISSTPSRLLNCNLFPAGTVSLHYSLQFPCRLLWHYHNTIILVKLDWHFFSHTSGLLSNTPSFSHPLLHS